MITWSLYQLVVLHKKSINFTLMDKRSEYFPPRSSMLEEIKLLLARAPRCSGCSHPPPVPEDSLVYTRAHFLAFGRSQWGDTAEALYQWHTTRRSPKSLSALRFERDKRTVPTPPHPARRLGLPSFLLRPQLTRARLLSSGSV